MSLYDDSLIDAHHHLWSLANGQYPWLAEGNDNVTAVGTLDPIRRDYLVEDYLHDVRGQNLVGSVHVEALAVNPLAEVEWLDALDKPKHCGERYVAGGDPASAEFPQLVDSLLVRRRVVAVRSILSWHPEPRLRFTSDPRRAVSSAWREGVGYLRSRGLMLELMMYPYQAEQVLELARTFPDLQIIVNHCCSPIDADADGITRWHQALAVIAQASNVYIKLSNPGAYVPKWDDEAICRILRGCLDAFGYERAIFATDLPVAKLFMDAEDVFRLGRLALSSASQEEQRKVFYANAKAIYRMGGV